VFLSLANRSTTVVLCRHTGAYTWTAFVTQWSMLYAVKLSARATSKFSEKVTASTTWSSSP